MARDGSGTYTLPESSFVEGTVVDEAAVNNNFSDIATALTDSIDKGGSTTVTANIKMGSNKLTGLSVGSAATDSLNLGQAQAEGAQWGGTAGGTADAITLTPSPAITAYAAGMRFVWLAGASPNTGAATININGVGAVAMQNDGGALVAGDHAAGKMYMGVCDGTQFQITRLKLQDTTELLSDTSPQLGGTLDTNSQQVRWSKGGDVASAGALTLGTDGNYFDITGTTTITSIGTLGVGTVVKLHFDGVMTLTHHATDLVLPGGANITTAAGDEAEFVEYAAGDWRCTNYTKASGEPVVSADELVKVYSATYAAYASTTTQMPVDDTIPQNTEGTELVTVTLTPRATTNRLHIMASAVVSPSATDQPAMALFQDSTANALKATNGYAGAGDYTGLNIHHEMAAGTTSSTTFKLRAGPNGAVTLYINGNSGGRKFGGVQNVILTVMEVPAT